MTTVINNPGPTEGERSGMGLIIGAIVAVVIIALFFMYVLPTLRGNEEARNTDDNSFNLNIDLPDDSDGRGDNNSGNSGSGSQN